MIRYWWKQEERLNPAHESAPKLLGLKKKDEEMDCQRNFGQMLTKMILYILL